jgi:hypothetical protein
MNKIPVLQILKTGALFVVAAVTIAIGTPSADAAAIPYTLTLQENSSTSLTYTYTNPTDPMPFTVTQGIGGGNQPDSWTVTINPMSGITLNSAFTFDFAEGPGETSLNRVQGGSSTGFNNTFAINSDLVIGSNGLVTSVKIGTDDGVDIFLQYIDLAAASETTAPGVPEGGSSLILLGLSLAGFVGLARFRKVQLA